MATDQLCFFQVQVDWRRVIEIGHLSDTQRNDLIARMGAVNGIREVSIVTGETVARRAVDELVYDDVEVQKLINI